MDGVPVQQRPYSPTLHCVALFLVPLLLMLVRATEYSDRCQQVSDTSSASNAQLLTMFANSPQQHDHPMPSLISHTLSACCCSYSSCCPTSRCHCSPATAGCLVTPCAAASCPLGQVSCCCHCIAPGSNNHADMPSQARHSLSCRGGSSRSSRVCWCILHLKPCHSADALRHCAGNLCVLCIIFNPGITGHWARHPAVLKLLLSQHCWRSSLRPLQHLSVCN